MSTKTTRPTFLIYRPVMDYEESINPYFTCSTREQAEKAVEMMRDYMERLLKRLPKYPDEDSFTNKDVFEERWEIVDDKRRDMLKRAKWPFGISLSSEIEFGRNDWDKSCIAIMELVDWNI